MKLKFVKTEGGGNDFILVDKIGRSDKNINWSKVIPYLCTRKHGIGADGVLVLEGSLNHDFTMRIFNPDGGEVEMCGNGARCSAYYYALKKEVEETGFDTKAGVMKSQIGKGGQVKLSLPSPTQTELDFLIDLNDRELGVSYINTGVPHVVVETDRLDDVDVQELGRSIRYHGRFAPQGTNANFVEVAGKSSLRVRTYERGVEEETLACGTGAVASAVIQSLRGKVKPPVKVKTRGGEVMKVYFKQSDKEDLISRIYDVKLEGPVSQVFKGEIEINC
jgi:diaminopimelate epimerase